MSEHIALPQRRHVPLRSTLVAAVAIVAVAAASVWVVQAVSSSDGSSPATGSGLATNAHAATPAGLRATAKALGHAIYWVGARTNTTYELTVTTAGLTYVRYLTGGAKVGDVHPRFVTVGTYPKQNAYSVLAAARKVAGARVQSFGNGELAVSYANRPKSVYVARRGSNLMVEVFAPAKLEAETIVRNGLVAPLS
jgi:hypothetical protein